MSATVMPPTEPQAVSTKLASQIEEIFAKCDCCGLTEECTITYVDQIRERFQGKWICGLCAEAVKDEIARCEGLMISTEEALTHHINFCNKFKSSPPPPNSADHLISAMRQILRRSLDSPPKVRSVPSSPRRSAAARGGGGGRMDRSMSMGVLSRSESCIPALSLVMEEEGNE